MQLIRWHALLAVLIWLMFGVTCVFSNALTFVRQGNRIHCRVLLFEIIPMCLVLLCIGAGLRYRNQYLYGIGALSIVVLLFLWVENFSRIRYGDEWGHRCAVTAGTLYVGTLLVSLHDMKLSS